MMRTVLALTRKEMEQYFASPIAYVVVTLFLLLSGFFFYIYLGFYIQSAQYAAQMGGEGNEVSQSIIRPFLANISFFFLIMFPMLTMKTMAEEKKLGTFELLMTSPITTVQLLLGKFLGALSLMAVILLLLGIYPLVLFIYGSPDPGPIWTGFLGLFLLGAAFMASGIFFSS
ncbi:MAG TPA: ABC transporter permease, partial [Acidobacteriota bacterium]|nr:ABC transporter permease [Acidobacteriota bacterium]